MAGGGRRKRSNQKKSNHRARQPAKDNFPSHQLNESPISEELTALAAIFQDDFTVISEDGSCTEISINLLPHSGGGKNNVSAELYARCLPGYPSRPPKLHVKAKEGLSEDDLQSLQSLLVDQATSISREGRVMIFNLVEAAQEFLSERVEQDSLHEKAASETTDDDWSMVSESPLDDIKGTSIHGVIDLFTELGDETHWKSESHPPSEQDMNELTNGPPSNAGRQNIVGLDQLNPFDMKGAFKKPFIPQFESKNLKRLPSNKTSARNDHDCSVSLDEVIHRIYNRDTMTLPTEELSATCDIEVQLSDPSCFSSLKLAAQKDFLLAHCVRLLCSQRGLLPHAWPDLPLQLQKLDVMPHNVWDLIINRPQKFDVAFRRIFSDFIEENILSGGRLNLKGFWNSALDIIGDESGRSNITSRYSNDFEELSVLGRGGFGHVVLCKNNIDGRHYAMKKIRLNEKSLSLNNKILREVTTLSRLQHHHIVRYYQAWFETVVGVKQTNSELEVSGASEWEKSDSSFKPLDSDGSIIDDGAENLEERIYLYIQMEYCPRTLREILDSREKPMDEVTIWRIFRQIVEGLAHIHGQGIIHRDLTPNNIFFDVCNDIKIGDFGLAKFTNLEQPDKETLTATDTVGSSLDGTGQVGTYFYTAPEIGQALLPIDEKVDMYSLGVVLFELWHPFNTLMERYVTLNDLKVNGVPHAWALAFPQQAGLVRSLISANPSERPSAMDVLRNYLPPRMEDEALHDVLRTIQSGESSYAIDRIISALFDQERVSLIAQKLDKANLNDSCISRTVFQDRVLQIAIDVFATHGAQRFNTCSMSLISEDDIADRNRIVTMIDSAGRILELRSEMRRRFLYWVAMNQITSIKRFEISQVYRRATGPNAPEEYWQGDFDIIGDSVGLPEAESIKVVVDIISKCTGNDSYEVHINHTSILEAIWLWSGVKNHERKDVAKLLSLVGCAPPQSSDRKTRWTDIRKQLVQGLRLTESVVDRLQTVERRWNGIADVSLSRLRGGLAEASNSARVMSAIDELATLQSYLRVWNIGRDIHGNCNHVHIDAFMVPVEEYFRGIIFQIYIRRGSSTATSSAGMFIAFGGRYDQLIQRSWKNSLLCGLPAPGGVGVSIALEKLILTTTDESDLDLGIEVLVCSKGGGGLLRERMEIVSELWNENIKAEFVHSPSPSLTEQYNYANEHKVKWLVMITEADLLHKNTLEVRTMESRKVDTVGREGLVKFLLEKKNRTFCGK